MSLKIDAMNSFENRFREILMRGNLFIQIQIKDNEHFVLKLNCFELTFLDYFRLHNLNRNRFSFDIR